MRSELPPTSDKEFWGESRTQLIKKEKLKPAKDHYLVVEDRIVVCTSCPYPHTVSVDLNKYRIVNGEITPLSIAKVK